MSENKLEQKEETQDANGFESSDLLSNCDTCDTKGVKTRSAKHGFDDVTFKPQTIEICEDCIRSFDSDDITFDFIDNDIADPSALAD